MHYLGMWKLNITKLPDSTGLSNLEIGMKIAEKGSSEWAIFFI